MSSYVTCARCDKNFNTLDEFDNYMANSHNERAFRAPDVFHATDEKPRKLGGEIRKGSDRVLHGNPPDHSADRLEPSEHT